MKPEIYNELTSNMKELEGKLVNFVREETAKRGFKKVILGLSGDRFSSSGFYNKLRLGTRKCLYSYDAL